MSNHFPNKSRKTTLSDKRKRMQKEQEALKHLMALVEASKAPPVS